jgi:putative beta-barrel porin BBP2
MLMGLACLVLAAMVDFQPAATPSPSPEPSPDPTVEILYRSILPSPPDSEIPTDPDAAGAEAGGTVTAPRDDAARGGLHLGRVQLLPAFDAVYVRAEGAFLDTPEPVQDSYFELRPRIGAEMPVSTGFLRGAYSASIRRGSSIDVVESTITHVADLSLDLPIGGIGEITASEHYSQGLLETTEVDRGREYFFDLGRFKRNRHSLDLRLLPGGRTNVNVGGSLDSVRIDDEAGFFDHEQQAVSAQIGYELTPLLNAALGYGYARIPFTAERPQAESSMHSVFGALRGEILPLTTGSVSVGYSTQTSLNAGPGGTRFTGLTASGSLEKSFTPSSNLTLAFSRGTNVSGFEENAFYVTNSIGVGLRAGLPWSLALQAGVGYHRNDYRTDASAIGAPRRDTIRGWTLGLARPISRYAFVRADYRRERRDSNIDDFDSPSNALTVQLGLGLFATQSR